MKKIKLSKKYISLIDNEDFKKVSQYKWYVHFGPRNKKPRAKGRVNGQLVYMHRFIMDAKTNEDIDHIDGDALNNCRNNLRVATQSENNYNATKKRYYQGKKCSSKYKGVVFVNRMKSRPWRALAYKPKIRIHLGYFATEEKAALAYNEYAKANYGKFARLNIIT